MFVFPVVQPLHADLGRVVYDFANFTGVEPRPYVCVCVCVCLFVASHISETSETIYAITFDTVTSSVGVGVSAQEGSVAVWALTDTSDPRVQSQ